MNGPKKKPALKISAKHRETKERLDIGAAWLGDDGRIQGLRLADGVKIKLADGTVLTRESTGKDGSHWLDVFVNETVHAGEKRDTRAPAARGDDFPPEDFSDQDIGF
jgi:hypothetical protein